MLKVILHIPHSSLKIPKFFWDNSFLLHKTEIEKFNLAITDLYTNQLFSAQKFTNVQFEFSRVFCDVEKFVDDNKESMAKYGMGVIYTHDNHRQKFFAPCSEYKNKVLKEYYFPYHEKLNNVVNSFLQKMPCVLIDCHSFSKDIIMTEISKPLPDICIGVNNDNSTSQILTNFVLKYFQSLGYNVSINFPYSGTMVPNDADTSHNKLFSIMIEVNREMYLDGDKKNKNFKVLQKNILNLLLQIQNLKIE